MILFIISLSFNLDFNYSDIFVFGENKDIGTEYNCDILKNITFSYCGKIYCVDDLNINLSAKQKVICCDFEKSVQVLNFAILNGFDIEKAFLYAFPQIAKMVKKIDEENLILPQNAEISVNENTAKTILINSKNGSKIDKISLFNEILYNFNEKTDKNNFVIKQMLIEPEVKTSDVEKYNFLRSSFVTNFSSSSSQRKNNIKNALSKFDGIVLNPGEVLSFNKQTGIRNEDAGYQKAKIIKNGVFVDEYGGGVCQVSTTIYNASLIAGLEILEVHPHSLPVSYIEPCFDAMVNMGSSDLVIKNNLEYPVVFATSSNNDVCKVNIYGQYKDFSVVRKSEKIEDIECGEKVYTTDYIKYGFNEPLKFGEEKILSHSKPGYKAKGWLEFYRDDVLIKTKEVRSNTYNPTNETILRGE